MCKHGLLKLLCWNADGVGSKIHELMNLVSALGVDVVAISESRLSSKFSLEIPGYVIYRQDRHCSGRGQGVAIFVKQNIEHSIVSIPNTQHIEAVAISMLISGREHVLVSAYQSPNLLLITNDLDILLALGQHVVIMGDFNANHDLWIPGIKN